MVYPKIQWYVMLKYDDLVEILFNLPLSEKVLENVI